MKFEKRDLSSKLTCNRDEITPITPDDYGSLPGLKICNKFLENSKEKTIFCIIGTTCAGKDTLVSALCEDEKFSPIVSYTDRPIRDNETDGVEHYFVSEDEMTEIINNRKDDIIAYTEIKKDEKSKGYRYLALRDELSIHNVYIIDPAGLENLKDNVKKIKTIVIDAPLEVRLERAAKRKDKKEEVMKRVENESKMFEDFINSKDYELYIDNSSFDNFEKNIKILREFCNSYLD